MRRMTLLLLLLLAACNTPGPHFRGLPPTRVTVDGSTFDIRVRGDMAEALRVNMQYAPRFGPIRARAAFAMAQVSGCRVKQVTGDQALATGRLSCGARPAPGQPSRPAASYSCLELRQWAQADGGRDLAEFECDPA